jgi:hypothetical protein
MLELSFKVHIVCIFSYCIYDVTVLFGLLDVAILNVLAGAAVCFVVVGHHRHLLYS